MHAYRLFHSLLSVQGIVSRNGMEHSLSFGDGDITSRRQRPLKILRAHQSVVTRDSYYPFIIQTTYMSTGNPNIGRIYPYATGSLSFLYRRGNGLFGFIHIDYDAFV